MNNLSKPAIVDKYCKLDERPIKKENSVIEKIWNWFDTFGVFLLLLSIFGLHLAYPILCHPCNLSLTFVFLLVTYGLATLAKAFNVIG
eukprot:07192.XXX_370031_370357_1 [CDS] Oithona nana genome sequencing.